VLDAVLKLIEKISELARLRSEKKDRSFEKLVKPIYDSLKLVHKDYIHIFESAKKDIESGLRFKDVAEHLESKRLSEEPERHAILSQVEILAKDEKLSEWHSFFEGVIDYFRNIPFSGHSTPSVVLLQQLKKLEKNQFLFFEDVSTRKEVIHSLEINLQHLRFSWERVSEEYAKSLASVLR